MAKIVIIEDEENLRFSIAKRLQKAGHTTVESDTVEEALDLIEKDEPDAILTDINLAGKLNGLDLVRTVRENGFGGSVIVMTAYGSIENAIEAIKDGADEYLPKPISLEEVCLVLDRSLGNHKVRNQLTLYQRLARSKSKERSLLGESPAWQDVVSLAQRMAHLPVASGNELSAILLMGETGVGKGRLARYIHDNCPDPSAPFVHVNCSALPPTLIESELFGHQKGAFTDARETRQGLFELADGGTIFLDEIGDMPLEPQSKLLIVVEQGVYRRIGATSERKANARIIAATNADLMNRVEDGTFRRDLFYRLNPLTISIPSLRERGDDAVILAKHLLAAHRRKAQRPGLTFHQDTIEAIRQHSWPGNVRELVNAMQRAAFLSASDEITPADLGLSSSGLPDEVPAPSPADSNGRLNTGFTATAAQSPADLTFDFKSGRFSAEEVEKHLMRSALQHTNGNVSRAAKLIGMNRSSFRYRIERYELESLIEELSSP